MAITINEPFSGSASIGATETSLVTNTAGPDAETSDGAVQAVIDFNALAAGDQYRVRIYEKARSADTQRRILEAYVTGAQSDPIWTHPTLQLMHGWDVTLQKITGTDRTITWSIRTP